VEVGDAVRAGMTATVIDVSQGSLVVEMKFGEEKVAEKTYAVTLENTEFVLSSETIVAKPLPKARDFVISAKVSLDERTARLAGSRELSEELTFPIEITLPETEEARQDQPAGPEVVNRFVGTWSITMELIEGGTIDEMPAEERRKEDVMTFEISKTAAGGLDVQTGFRVANVKIVGETLNFSHVGNPIEHIELTLSESDSWMSGTLETGSGPFKRWRLTADRR
jgi:hypothetical protein